MKKIIKIIIVLSVTLIVVSCNVNDANTKQVIPNFENEVKIKEDKIKDLEKEKENIENEFILIEEKNKKLTEEIKELTKENRQLSMDYYTYEAIYNDYREYINSTINEVTIDDTYFKINSIAIGSSFKDVYNILGEPLEEKILANDAGYGGNDSFMVWEYGDDLKVTFNPLYVNTIDISGEEYETNFNVRVGDNALEALEYMNNDYEKFYSKHIEQNLLGWYYTKNRNVIVIYFNKDNKRLQNDMTITTDTKVERIELMTDTLD